MKKMIIGMIALVAVFVFCVHLLTSSITNEIDKERNKYKVKIGQKFILEKDTLTIIDYSSIMETFTLSNGKEVNASIVFNKDSVSVK
jgi:hypothetical protein